MEDINDVFDSILLLEDRVRQSGYAEGIRIGHETGWKDGYILGIRKGSEIGAEIGFYKGCALGWKCLLEKINTPSDSRKSRVLLSLTNLLEDFPSSNLTTEDSLQKLQEIRAKHKQNLLDAIGISGGEVLTNLLANYGCSLNSQTMVARHPLVVVSPTSVYLKEQQVIYLKSLLEISNQGQKEAVDSSF